MITDDFIIQSWGEDVIKFSPNILADKLIPNEAKEYLQKVGIPMELDTFKSPFARLAVTENLDSFDYENIPYTILGYGEYGQKLCINSHDGSIVIIKPDLLMDFLNSSIQSFVVFFTLYHNLFTEFSGNIPKDKFSQMREIMLSEDPIAFSHTRYTWGVIIDEIDLALYG